MLSSNKERRYTKMYDIISRGKIIDTKDTYEEAWAIADKIPHAIVRWFEEVK